MLTSADQDRTVVCAVLIFHALTATASWSRWICEPFTREGRGWCCPQERYPTTKMGEEEEGFGREENNGFVVGLGRERSGKLGLRVEGETYGRSKQTTSRVVCFCLKGAEVGFCGSMFRVIA
jgi:hypothetical protein